MGELREPKREEFESRQEYIHRYKMEKRWARIFEVNCKCPKCGEVKTDSRSWVVKRTIIMCRRCWFMRLKLASVHYEFDGREMRKARRETGLSQEAFANACGWSRTYQTQLENPWRRHVVPEATAKLIVAALKLYGVEAVLMSIVSHRK